MKLSYYINFILELEERSLLEKSQSECIDGFDRGILMMDDIQDRSKTRNNVPCFYIIHGIEKTKEEAKKLRRNAFRVLGKISKERDLSLINSICTRIVLLSLDIAVKKGQSIDIELEKASSIKRTLLRKYDKMVQLFTGGHIKYGFLLGFLFSKSNPSYKKSVVTIGENIGIIRQIFDDIKDYRKEHHEPLGDLINSKKRLPELLFLLYATTEEKASLIKLLENPEQNFSEVVVLVLNENVKNMIREKISTIKNRIDIELEKIPPSYQIKLRTLLYEFYEPNF